MVKIRCFGVVAAIGMSLGLARPALAVGEAVLTDGVLTFDVDASAYPEGTPYLYDRPLTSDVTAIVKKGTGSVSLGSYDNASFTGTVTVETDGGYLMGWSRAFRNASEIVVKAGGAMMFTETEKDGTLNKTHFRIAGSGPDGAGALLRPCVAVGTAVDYFKTITLEADATIGTGSRWGLTSGTLDMGNHTLTLRSDRHVETGWGQDWVAFDLRGTVAVRNPGAIVVESGLINFEGNDSVPVRLVDADGSNGTVSNLTITVKGDRNSRVRIMGVAKGGVPCRLVTEGTPSLMTYANAPEDEPLKYSNWDGPVSVGATRLDLLQYNNDCPTAGYVFNAEVSGVGVLGHDIRGHLAFTGSSTNTLGGLTQNANGTTLVTDDVHLNVTGGTVAEPSTLALRDRASLVEIPTPADRLQRTAYRIGETGKYGLLTVSGDAVVSNDVALGLRGFGACYQFGGRLHLLDGRQGNGVVYIGYSSKSYGYLGIDDGLFTQDYWCYLGAYSSGFMVQRGGLAHQGWQKGGVPLRIGFSGASSYGHYAVLGGKAVWRNYAALNFSSYRPNSMSSTAIFTVDGSEVEVDMSESYIRSVPSTNAAACVTALVNVGHGGTLKVKYISVEQIPNRDAPAWETIKDLAAQGTKTYLNFNGGVLVTAQAGDFFTDAAGTVGDPCRLPTRATVYEQGLVIDTDGKDVVWRMPLERPYGHGIRSIILPDEARVAKVLLGPTRCRIVSSCGGAGADALMDFDNTNRVARGLLVTSPGFGYEAEPTATVQSPDGASTWTCSVETTDYDADGFSHGGLVKRGAGTLTVTGANTYGGATRLEGGTLTFTHSAGLPSASVLEFSARGVVGCTDGQPLLQAPEWNGGDIRVTAADAIDATSFGRRRMLARFDVPLTAIPPYAILNEDGTDASGKWRISLSSDRKCLYLCENRGFLIMLK